MQVLNSTQMVISPPIVSAQGETDAELEYKNTEVTESATASIVFLNVTAAAINPFFVKDALEFIPGRYAVEAGNGAAVMRGTTENGFELVMTKFFDMTTFKTKYRMDVLFGVVNKQPEMSGILLFGQS
jgi:hypothetical protein